MENTAEPDSVIAQLPNTEVQNVLFLDQPALKVKLVVLIRAPVSSSYHLCRCYNMIELLHAPYVYVIYVYIKLDFEL